MLVRWWGADGSIRCGWAAFAQLALVRLRKSATAVSGRSMLAGRARQAGRHWKGRVERPTRCPASPAGVPPDVAQARIARMGAAARAAQAAG